MKKHQESEAHKISSDRERRREERRQHALSTQQQRDLRKVTLTAPMASLAEIEHPIPRILTVENCLDDSILLDGALYNVDGDQVFLSAGVLPDDQHCTEVLAQISSLGDQSRYSRTWLMAGAMDQQPNVEGIEWQDSDSEADITSLDPVLSLVSSLVEHHDIGENTKQRDTER